ncbi:MFS transporter [Rhodococcus sp. USK10]|uniref:MFS transporter n=1 Tax=Rhodococcus sp. USK10 TaxID=2789739 RepID=UPI0021509B16|nr:MFS transporter [Rhodococcus sp. USK10]
MTTTPRIARFVAGVGLGGLGPAAIALTMSVAPHDKRNFLNGVMLTGLPVGGIVAALSALAFLEGGGWRAVFLVGGVIPLLAVVPIGAAKLRTWAPDGAVATTASRRNVGVSLRTLLGDGGARALAGFVVVTGCCQVLSYGLLTWLPQIMKSSGYSLGSSLVFVIVFSIGAMAGSASGSRAADQIGGRRVTIAGFAIGGVCGPILGGVLAGLPALVNFSVFAGIAAFASLLSLAVLTSRHHEPAPINTTVPV